MVRFIRPVFHIHFRKYAGFLLAVFWVLGLISGCIHSHYASGSSFTMMHGILHPVSIVSLLAVVLLPFLVSAFAVYISQTWLFIPIAFMKALSYSVVSTGIIESYGSAGWLVQFLLMFSSFCLMPVLFFYWLRYISGSRAVAAGDVFLVIFLVFGICGIDCYLVSPILAGI